jgi:hypothetical protein
MRGSRCFGAVALSVFFGLLITCGAWGQFASTVVGYDHAGANNGYDDPNAVLGSPDRMTADYPSGTAPVTIFNPAWGEEANAWGSDQVFSLGLGGYIEVMFDAAVVDDPLNPYGIDLIVFGNAGLLSADWPATTCTNPAGTFGADYGAIEVSQDGVSWVAVSPPYADTLFPTTGWTDAAHTAPSSFLRPVDPSLGLSSFDGLTETEVLALYAGSGGGTGIDLAGTGLGWIRYVRVSNNGHPSSADGTVDVDAFADVAAVPEPGMLLVGAALAFSLRHRKK